MSGCRNSDKYKFYYHSVLKRLIIHVLKIQEIKTKTKTKTRHICMSRSNAPLPLHPSLDTYYKYEKALLSLKKTAQFSSALTRKGNGKRQNLKINIGKGNIYPQWRRYIATRPVFVFIDNVCGTLNSQESIRFNSHYRNDCFTIYFCSPSHYLIKNVSTQPQHGKMFSRNPKITFGVL